MGFRSSLISSRSCAKSSHTSLISSHSYAKSSRFPRISSHYCTKSSRTSLISSRCPQMSSRSCTKSSRFPRISSRSSNIRGRKILSPLYEGPTFSLYASQYGDGHLQEFQHNTLAPIYRYRSSSVAHTPILQSV